MRMYAGKVGPIAADMVNQLTTDSSIEPEPEMADEVLLDIESVLREYIRTEREITNHARELISKGGLEFRQLNKLKSKIADERGFGIGDKALYLGFVCHICPPDDCPATLRIQLIRQGNSLFLSVAVVNNGRYAALAQSPYDILPEASGSPGDKGHFIHGMSPGPSSTRHRSLPGWRTLPLHRQWAA